MKVITIAGAKGGTGKTTTALTVASELATGGLRVALADCDPQASATSAFRHAPVADPCAAQEISIELGAQKSVKTDTEAPCSGGLWLLRGGRPLATATKAEIHAHLKRADGYVDVVVVDTVPTIGPITMAAIEAAELVIVPLQPAPLPVAGLFDMLRLVQRVNSAARARAVLTLVKHRRAMVDRIARQIELKVPGLLYESRIPDDAQCEWALTAFQAVTRFNHRSTAAAAYRSLTNEIRADLGLRAPPMFDETPSEEILPLFRAGGIYAVR